MIKKTYNPFQEPKVGDYVKVTDPTLPPDFTCRVARVAYVDEMADEYGRYLVEFIESHPRLHNGMVREAKCKNHHGWWVGKEDMAPLKVDAMIMSDGDTIYCQRSDKRRITGTATCSKLDEYDPMVGAMIAFARAHGADPTAAAYKVLQAFSKIPTEESAPTPKKLRLVFSSTGGPYGELGAPTPYKDKDGVPLYVGDQVEIRHVDDPKPLFDLHAVVKTPVDGPFVMGILSDCDTETGKVKGWELTRVKSWKELKPGDKVHGGYIDVVKVPAAPAPKLEILKGKEHYGIVGTPTKMKDCRGAQLFVGDRVKICSNYTPYEGEHLRLVVEDYQEQFVMGIKGSCNADTGKITDNWRIEKVKGFQSLTTDYVDPDPDFDFRVVEAPAAPAPKPKKKRRVIRFANYPGLHCGILGTPTKLVDVRGLPLFVGDVVELWSDKKGVLGEEPVVQDTDRPDQFFVMGCAGCDFTKDGADGGFRIRKVKSFTELRLEETLSDGWFVVKEEEIAPEKKLVLRWSFGNHKLLGNVGDPTPLIDRDGKKLCIGDQVECFHDGAPMSGIEPIVLYKECGPESNGGYYAMGLASIDFAAPGDHEGYAIRKVKSYTELKPGELLSNGPVEVKEEEVDE